MEFHGSGRHRDEVPRIRDAARACPRVDVASPKLRARQCLIRVSSDILTFTGRPERFKVFVIL